MPAQPTPGQTNTNTNTFTQGWSGHSPAAPLGNTQMRPSQAAQVKSVPGQAATVSGVQQAAQNAQQQSIPQQGHPGQPQPTSMPPMSPQIPQQPMPQMTGQPGAPPPMQAMGQPMGGMKMGQARRPMTPLEKAGLLAGLRTGKKAKAGSTASGSTGMPSPRGKPNSTLSKIGHLAPGRPRLGSVGLYSAFAGTTKSAALPQMQAGQTPPPSAGPTDPMTAQMPGVMPGGSTPGQPAQPMGGGAPPGGAPGGMPPGVAPGQQPQQGAPMPGQTDPAGVIPGAGNTGQPQGPGMPPPGQPVPGTSPLPPPPPPMQHSRMNIGQPVQDLMGMAQNPTPGDTPTNDMNDQAMAMGEGGETKTGFDLRRLGLTKRADSHGANPESLLDLQTALESYRRQQYAPQLAERHWFRGQGYNLPHHLRHSVSRGTAPEVLRDAMSHDQPSLLDRLGSIRDRMMVQNANAAETARPLAQQSGMFWGGGLGGIGGGMLGGLLGMKFHRPRLGLGLGAGGGAIGGGALGRAAGGAMSDAHFAAPEAVSQALTPQSAPDVYSALSQIKTSSDDHGGELSAGPMRGWMWKAMRGQEDSGTSNWMPRVFTSEATPLPEMLASPAKQSILKGLMGGGVGAGLGALAGGAVGNAGAGAAAGGAIGAGIGSFRGYAHRRAENDRIVDAMRRLPPGATLQDYQDLQKERQKKADLTEEDEDEIKEAGILGSLGEAFGHFFNRVGKGAGRTISTAAHEAPTVVLPRNALGQTISGGSLAGKSVTEQINHVFPEMMPALQNLPMMPPQSNNRAGAWGLGALGLGASANYAGMNKAAGPMDWMRSLGVNFNHMMGRPAMGILERAAPRMARSAMPAAEGMARAAMPAAMPAAEGAMRSAAPTGQFQAFVPRAMGQNLDAAAAHVREQVLASGGTREQAIRMSRQAAQQMAQLRPSPTAAMGGGLQDAMRNFGGANARPQAFSGLAFSGNAGRIAGGPTPAPMRRFQIPREAMGDPSQVAQLVQQQAQAMGLPADRVASFARRAASRSAGIQPVPQQMMGNIDQMSRHVVDQLTNAGIPRNQAVNYAQNAARQFGQGPRPMPTPASPFAAPAAPRPQFQGPMFGRNPGTLRSTSPIPFEGPAYTHNAGTLKAGSLRERISLLKRAGQDNSAPQRSSTGDSKGLTYAHKPDHYAQGPEAWASVTQYFKGGKYVKDEPDLQKGRHSGFGKSGSLRQRVLLLKKAQGEGSSSGGGSGGSAGGGGGKASASAPAAPAAAQPAQTPKPAKMAPQAPAAPQAAPQSQVAQTPPKVQKATPQAAAAAGQAQQPAPAPQQPQTGAPQPRQAPQQPMQQPQQPVASPVAPSNQQATKPQGMTPQLPAPPAPHTPMGMQQPMMPQMQPAVAVPVAVPSRQPSAREMVDYGQPQVQKGLRKGVEQVQGQAQGAMPQNVGRQQQVTGMSNPMQPKPQQTAPAMPQQPAAPAQPKAASFRKRGMDDWYACGGNEAKFRQTLDNRRRRAEERERLAKSGFDIAFNQFVKEGEALLGV